MKYKFTVAPDAIEDIQNGVDYYNEQQKGLGKRFNSTITTTFAKIKKMPFAASISFDDTRYKVVDKFPYTIFYRVTGSVIIIARVFNTHQQPFYE